MQNPKNLIFQYTIPFYLEIESIISSKKRKRKKKKGERVDRSKIHRFTRKMIRWKMEWAVKFLSGSNDGQSIQIYFFDLFVRRNENSIINVAPLYIHIYIYISPGRESKMKDSFLENLDDQPGTVYF